MTTEHRRKALELRATHNVLTNAEAREPENLQGTSQRSERLVPIHPSDLVSVRDIAERLGLRRHQVRHMVRSDSRFPRPLTTVANGTVPIYDWRDVDRWSVRARLIREGRPAPVPRPTAQEGSYPDDSEATASRYGL